MRYPAKLLSLATLAALLFPSIDVAASQRPTRRFGFSETTQQLRSQSERSPTLAQSTDAANRFILAAQRVLDLRFFSLDGDLIPTPEEQAVAAQQ